MLKNAFRSVAVLNREANMRYNSLVSLLRSKALINNAKAELIVDMILLGEHDKDFKVIRQLEWWIAFKTYFRRRSESK